jgi:hypothetical protein
MNVGSSNSVSSANVSHADWCLAATRIAPRGIFSSPRQSTVMPQMIRSSARSVRAQWRASAMMARRGINSVGIATTR